MRCGYRVLDDVGDTVPYSANEGKPTAYVGGSEAFKAAIRRGEVTKTLCVFASTVASSVSHQPLAATAVVCAGCARACGVVQVR